MPEMSHSDLTSAQHQPYASYEVLERIKLILSQGLGSRWTLFLVCSFSNFSYLSLLIQPHLVEGPSLTTFVQQDTIFLAYCVVYFLNNTVWFVNLHVY